MKASTRKAMPIGIMLATPENTFTIAAAWVMLRLQTNDKYGVITNKAKFVRMSAHIRTAMEEEKVSI